MKEMSKSRILTKRSVKSVMNERQILTQLHNPFLVNMYYAFQDRESLYLVMDLLNGGDLRYHICKYRRFDEETTSKSPFLFVILLSFIQGSLQHVWSLVQNIATKNKSSTGTSNLRILLQTMKATLESQTSVLLESGDLRMLKTPQELQDTWLLRSCADRIIQLQQITLLLE